MHVLIWLGVVAQALGQAPDEVWVWAPGPAQRTAVREIGLGFAEGSEGGWIRMSADPEMLIALDRAAIPWYRDQDAPLRRSRALSGYHSPDDMIEALDTLEAEHPALVERVDLGHSLLGRSIAGVRISGTDQARAGWRILGAHHGDELSSAELALETAQALVSGYGSDPEITALLDQDAVWVFPHINPDGVAAVSRYNHNTVDLNRNYAYQWTANEYRSGEHPFSEPETASVRALTAWTAFGAGLSMHSGAANLGWVWNYNDEATPDDTLLSQLATRYADSCSVEDFWITNGAAWYKTWGDTNDWSYGRFGILDFTLEVSIDKTPDSSLLPGLMAGHLPAVMTFLTWPHVISGQVVDAETGLGIPASVTLVEDGWPLLTGPDGRFGRPVEPGAWTVEVTAPGYLSEVLSLDTTLDESPEIALTPQQLVELEVSPALLSQGGGGNFALSRAASSVVLSRPGEDTTVAVEDGAGWWVDPTQLAPGPWTLRVDGDVVPRALFIGEVDDAVEISQVEYSSQGETLTIDGVGFGRGSRLWALVGIGRSLVELPRQDETVTQLGFDVSGLARDEATIDLVLFTAGRQLAVIDMKGKATVDTDAPEEEFVDPSDGDGSHHSDPEAGTSGRVTASSCQVYSGQLGSGLLPGLILLGWRRRT